MKKNNSQSLEMDDLLKSAILESKSKFPTEILMPKIKNAVPIQPQSTKPINPYNIKYCNTGI